MLRSLALRSSVIATLTLSVAACSGSSDATASDDGAGGGGGGSDDGGARDASLGGDAGGTGGQGGEAGGGGAGSSGSAGTDETDGAAGAAGSALDGGDTDGPTCPQGTFLGCDGNAEEVCDGHGGQELHDCGSDVCDSELGCVVCRPATGTCDGDVSHACRKDGSGYTDVTCDPELGVTCDTATGRCVGDCSPDALGESYVGCEYYPTATVNAFQGRVDGDTAQSAIHFAVVVSNTSQKPASIKITRGATTVETATIPPLDVQVIALPWVDSLQPKQISSSVLAKRSAYRLTSNEPVVVYQFNPIGDLSNVVSGGYGSDAALLLPVNVWTGAYRVAAYNSAGGDPGYYAVTASEDGTQVQIGAPANATVKAGIAGLPASGSGTITLDRGDVAEVFSTTTAQRPSPYDLTGTLIQANKPVQVIAGVRCAVIPADGHGCNHIEESMFPLEALSTSYIVTPPAVTNKAEAAAQMVRIIATAPGTTLTYDPPQPGAPTSIANAGDFVEIANSTADFVVEATEKILVAQYEMTPAAEAHRYGVPLMALTVPTSQYRTFYLFHAPIQEGSDSTYVNVVAPTGATVTLDGASVTGFSSIGSSGYGVARVHLTKAGNGNHVIVAGGTPFGISVYGYSPFYFYPGGSDVQKR